MVLKYVHSDTLVAGYIGSGVCAVEIKSFPKNIIVS